MNGCLTWGIFPRKWKVANLITIPKGPERDRSSPKSYRSIWLLSVAGKLLERLMGTSMSTLFQDHDMTSDRQYGFRPER
jgi:retron-type reverse transcriptase